MRRKDREMPRRFAEEITDKCVYATLATVGVSGHPYCVPISIVRENNILYFHCAHDGEKIRNLRRNPHVCISCVGNTRVPEGKFTIEYESAILFGVAEEVTQPADKTHALKLLCLRHTPGNMADFDDAMQKSLERTAVWRITVTEVTGKRKKYDSQGNEIKSGGTNHDQA